MKTRYWFLIGVLLLSLLEAARVYFIMPFPGSQLDDAASLSRLETAYWLHQYASWLQVAGGLVLLVLAYRLLRKPARPWARWLVVGGAVLYGVVLYMVNGEMMADRMFQQPIHKQVVALKQNKIPLTKLVLGFASAGQATAYPIQLIGYHHQVRDTVGGRSIMVTYCTVCRTGRVFSPEPGGQTDDFRLVGMDHFNAMFEDKRTGTWWRQATGEAVVGPLRGQQLPELGARQMTLGEWVAEHPNTRVLQADPTFAKEFDHMKNYEKGLSKGELTRRDSASWQPKSWVVGVEWGGAATAFDWNQLQISRVLSGTVGTEPVLLTIAPDSVSFGAWSRRVNGKTRTFACANRQLTDHETGSVWTWRGTCVAGALRGCQLALIPKAYQEFWHSWRSFHPQTRQALEVSNQTASQHTIH